MGVYSVHASENFSHMIISSSVETGDSARPVQDCAIFAILGGAFIVHLTVEFTLY